ncbi:MAG: hypothetical protein J6T96_11565 [Bacteroidales bacterium]|nr:hypothetical protein [Bacteroidales bacterium]MBO7567640.1 hypothetical protein [Bacteroidales bacterium]MBP5682560.1 hypothetical protein [Bacteroidales bacterium]
MKLISKSTAAAISASALLLLQACGGSTTTQTTNGDNTAKPAQTTQEEQTTFYLLPSPEDIFAFSADKMKYSAALLNPTSKAETYVDTKMREINFGVYVADMAYAAAFGENMDAAKYMQTIKEASTQIGLESIFTNALTSRIDKFIENKDSLKAIANDTYYDIKKELEKNNRNSTIAQISAGGWVECMYIITNSIEKFSDKDPNIQHVADEKNVFTSLLKYLGQHTDKPGIASTLRDLKPIEEAYARLPLVDAGPSTTKSSSEDAIVIGKDKKIQINEDNFNLLKARISQVRQILTDNK